MAPSKEPSGIFQRSATKFLARIYIIPDMAHKTSPHPLSQEPSEMYCSVIGGQWLLLQKSAVEKNGQILLLFA